MSTRRDFLKTGGALVIGFSLGNEAVAQAAQGRGARGAAPNQPDTQQIDTWLAIHSDNTASLRIGFVELGQGNSTALPQIAAEELDLDLDRIRTVLIETNVTPNQGGTYSSASIARGGPQVRTAAAEARRALLEMASVRLGAPVDRLTVSNGVVRVAGDTSRSVTYGELIGNRRFNLAFTGSAPVKPVSEYKVVGKPAARKDVAAKVSGNYIYMQQVRVTGMLHGRIVRPRGQGAYGTVSKVLNVDEASIRSISGARVVRTGDFVGVVAENEWDAIRAAQQLKVTWDTPRSLPGSENLYSHMRAAQTEDSVVRERGDVTAALQSAPHVVKQVCHGPYQAHAPFGPNCAIADVKADSALVMCSTQDIYSLRNGLARMLKLTTDKVRVQYYEGSGTYGHSCHDDAAQAAVILSQAAGRPVRVQFMRWDEHGWDNYGPAHVGEVQAAADAEGRIVAYEYHGWQHSWCTTETSDQLAFGTPAAERPGIGAQGINPLTMGSMYEIPNYRLVNHKLPGLQYLKGAWLRSPLDLSLTFASEQAIDQLAFLLKVDPLEFRRRNIKDERWLGVLNAAAQAANWRPRVAASDISTARVVTGRGIGVGTHLASWGAAVAEIEVNRDTGRVVARRLYGAIDAGLVVNPAIVEAQIQGQLVQTASRMFKEEITFNETNVTSLDWGSYPILRFDECPEVTPVVVQRMNERSSGAGEEVMAAAAAAIANAFFDATGIRMDQYPLTPPRVQAAFRRALGPV
jgi:CO/xanthine dehydrogenase Mo-binding subunit